MIMLKSIFADKLKNVEICTANDDKVVLLQQEDKQKPTKGVLQDKANQLFKITKLGDD